jgi:hypothetical protein
MIALERGTGPGARDGKWALRRQLPPVGMQPAAPDAPLRRRRASATAASPPEGTSATAAWTGRAYSGPRIAQAPRRSSAAACCSSTHPCAATSSSPPGNGHRAATSGTGHCRHASAILSSSGHDHWPGGCRSRLEGSPPARDEPRARGKRGDRQGIPALVAARKRMQPRIAQKIPR